jgi:carbonic anhydrase/acetyltransferase-like protein (isoleucine patch superfamily)
MAIYALGDRVPDIHPDAWVHPQATVIGDVRIGAEATVWPQAVLRGDSLGITVGERTSIQDGAVVHVTSMRATVIGAGCVIGHLAHMEGCTVEDGALVGIGSILMPGVVVRSGAVVGAGAVVPRDVEVPPRAMALGVPARIRPDAVDPAVVIEPNARTYAGRAREYRAGLRRLD